MSGVRSGDDVIPEDPAGAAAASEAQQHWFGVQLEVTQKLIAAEAAKLESLKQDGKSDGEGDSDFYSLAQKRLQAQSAQLTKEYDQAASEFIASTINSRSRSLTSLGLKGLQSRRQRSSIFDSDIVDQVERPSSLEPPRISPGPGGRTSPVPGLTACGDLVLKKGRVLSGTVEAIIQHFIPRPGFEPDATLCFTFVVLSRLFVPPHRLLMLLDDAAAGACGKEMEHTADSLEMAQKLVRILRVWAETSPYDFRDERMMLPLKSLTQACANQTAELKTTVMELQMTLFKRLNDLERWEAKLKREYELQIRTKRETLSNGQRPGEALTELCGSPEELAEQLHFLEQERLAKIGPEEFVATFVAEAQADRESYCRPTHNIEAYVEWCNRLSSLVATELLRHDNKKARVTALEYFLQTAVICRKRQNFNSLMGIIAALNMTCVVRLKKTWARVNSKLHDQYNDVEDLLNPSSNFKAYREHLKSLPESKPVIPFFSLLVKDMFFANGTMPSRHANGHLNFEKYWMVSDLLASFVVRRENKTKITKNDKVLRYLRGVAVCNEAELFKMSVDAEPPIKRDRTKTMERLRRISQTSLNDVEFGMTKSASAVQLVPPPSSEADEDGEFGFGGG